MNDMIKVLYEHFVESFESKYGKEHVLHDPGSPDAAPHAKATGFQVVPRQRWPAYMVHDPKTDEMIAWFSIEETFDGTFLKVELSNGICLTESRDFDISAPDCFERVAELLDSRLS